ARLHDEPAAGRLPRRGLPVRLETQRRGPRPRPRLPAAPDGTAAVRLEECQVGARHRADGGGPARLLGGLVPRRLSHAPRPLGGATVPRLARAKGRGEHNPFPDALTTPPAEGRD